MLNLNPELVDQDKLRKAKRKRLLRYVIVPCAILVLCGAFLLRLGVFNVIFSTTYKSRNYEISKGLTDFQMIGNVIEPYISYYDRGTVKMLESSYVDAEADFRESLKQNPPERVICKIYHNLSLSIEAQGDASFEEKNYEQALLFYNRAQALINDSGCARKEGGENAEDVAKAKASQQRIEDKHNKVVKSMTKIEGEDQHEEIGEVNRMDEKQKERLEELRRDNGDNMVKLRLKSYQMGSSGLYCSSSNICW